MTIKKTSPLTFLLIIILAVFISSKFEGVYKNFDNEIGKFLFRVLLILIFSLGFAFLRKYFNPMKKLKQSALTLIIVSVITIMLLLPSIILLNNIIPLKFSYLILSFTLTTTLYGIFILIRKSKIAELTS